MERDYLLVGTDLLHSGTLHREGTVVRLDEDLAARLPDILKPVPPPGGPGPAPAAPPAPAAEEKTKRRKTK